MSTTAAVRNVEDVNRIHKRILEVENQIKDEKKLKERLSREDRSKMDELLEGKLQIERVKIEHRLSLAQEAETQQRPVSNKSRIRSYTSDFPSHLPIFEQEHSRLLSILTSLTSQVSKMKKDNDSEIWNRQQLLFNHRMNVEKLCRTSLDEASITMSEDVEGDIQLQANAANKKLDQLLSRQEDQRVRAIHVMDQQLHLSKRVNDLRRIKSVEVSLTCQTTARKTNRERQLQVVEDTTNEFKHRNEKLKLNLQHLMSDYSRLQSEFRASNHEKEVRSHDLRQIKAEFVKNLFIYINRATAEQELPKREVECDSSIFMTSCNNFDNLLSTYREVVVNSRKDASKSARVKKRAELSLGICGRNVCGQIK